MNENVLNLIKSLTLNLILKHQFDSKRIILCHCLKNFNVSHINFFLSSAGLKPLLKQGHGIFTDPALQRSNLSHCIPRLYTHKVTEMDQSYMIGVRVESSDVLLSVLTKVGRMSFLNLYLCWLPQATFEADAFTHSLPDYQIHVHLMFKRVDVRFSV